MSLTSLNSIKISTGQNYKFDSQKLSYLTSNQSGYYFLINSKTDTSFGSTLNTYTGLTMTMTNGDTLWASSLPQVAACYFYDGDNDNVFDEGEQLGFDFSGNNITNSDTVTVNGLTNTSTAYQYVLFALNDVATKTVYFNFLDSSSNNINTSMGYVTDPYTNSVPCSFPDNQGVYLVQVPKNANLAKIKIGFAGAFGTSYGVSLVGVLSSPTDFSSTNFPCFLDGTMIKTINGEKNISTLKSGDKLLNDKNEIVTVEHVWIKDVVVPHKTAQHNMYPNLIPKDYFEENKPNKDLYISPQHKISYNGVLIDSKFLDNVSQQIIELPFRYYNITLVEGYGTMIANGCVVETYKRKENVSIKDEKGMNLYR